MPLIAMLKLLGAAMLVLLRCITSYAIHTSAQVRQETCNSWDSRGIMQMQMPTLC